MNDRFKLTPDQRSNLRDQCPEATVFHTAVEPGSDFVFRPVGLAQFDAFLGAVNGDDANTKVYAHRNLALDCCLFPSRADLAAYAKERPAVVHALGNELARRAGLNSEIISEGL